MIKEQLTETDLSKFYFFVTYEIDNDKETVGWKGSWSDIYRIQRLRYLRHLIKIQSNKVYFSFLRFK